MSDGQRKGVDGVKIDDILDSIGELDDRLIKNAKNSASQNISSRSVMGLIAACLIIATVMPYMLFVFCGVRSVTPPKGNIANIQEQSKIVNVYYIEGDKLMEESVEAESGKSVFYTWREKNGLGEDVEYLQCCYVVFGSIEPSSCAVNLTISNNIENYYDTKDKDMLLDSLSLTMREYYDVPKEDFVLSI